MSTDQATARRTLLGIGFMCISATLFPVMSALVQVVSPRYGPVQLVWARQLSHLVVLVVVLGPVLGLRLVRTGRLRWQLLRSLTLLASTLLLYAGVRLLPLAKTISISLTGPLFVALLARPLLGERLGWPRLVAVAIGFAGALLVIRPGAEVFQPATLLIVGASLCYALFQILTRFVAGTDRPEVSAVYSVLVGAVVLSACVPFAWSPIASATDAAVLGLLGVLGAIGHYCVARALVHAPATLAAPFNYWQLVSAAVIGYVVSHELPDLGTTIGAIVIVGAGIFLAWWETRPAIERLRPVRADRTAATR
jgi:drug/metabolite transporter (DMT)-like permease